MTSEKLQKPIKNQYSPALHGASEDAWRDELDAAIRVTDEATIWRIMAEQQQNEEAHEALASMVSRMAYVHGNVNVFCELFMMPVIAPSGCTLINERNVWKSVRQAVKDALDNWFGKGIHTVIFEGVLPMDWITTWRPRIIRDHLHRLVPGSEIAKSEFRTEEIDLPETAPRLGFVLIACKRQKQWPEIPALNSSMDHRLKEVVRFAMQMAVPFEPPTNKASSTTHRVGSAFPDAPTVLTPERVQFAITDGIALWLIKLNEVVGIKGWAMFPSMTTPDVVKFTLRLDDDKVRLTQFTVRMHQIGLQGLSDINAALGAIAPNMETPSDMTADQYRVFQGFDNGLTD